MMNLHASNAGAMVTSVTSLTAIPSPVTIAPLAASRKDVRPAAICTTGTIWFGTRKLKTMRVSNAIRTMHENEAVNHFDKIERIAALIKSCDEWLTSEAPKYQIPANCILGTWLFESKSEWMKRYRLRQRVRERLLRYYTRLCKSSIQNLSNQ